MTQTSASTYTPTFMEKILGRNYKWWYVIVYYFKHASALGFANLVMIFTEIISTLMVLYIWNLNNAGTEIFTYLLIGRVYQAITNNYHLGTFAGDIFTGKITVHLLKPNGVLTYNYFSMLGKRSYRNLTELFGSVLAIIFAVFLFADVLILFNTMFILIFLIPITFSINQFLGSIFGTSAFWLKDPRDFNAIDRVFWVTRDLLTGAFIPLSLLPQSNIVVLTPFAWLLHHPMQIYLGNYNLNQTMLVFAGGFAWCFILYFLAKWVFKMGLKRNESVGL